jgi:hypothetical protein
VARRGSSGLGHIRGLRPFLSLNGIELNLVTLFQAFVTLSVIGL